MKVGLLGNMNNNFFALARFLRDRGIDAHVVLFDNEFDHFHPSADTLDDDYLHFCRRVEWGSPLAVMATSRKQIAEDLADFDVLIGCAAAPAYCEKAGRALDIFVPYGGDIYLASMYHFVRPDRQMASLVATWLQRRGIRRSGICHMVLTNDIYEQRHSTLRGNRPRWTVDVPMVYSPLFNPERMAGYLVGSQWGERFRLIRGGSQLVVFYHSRHEWKRSEGDPNHKGTDRLFKGLAMFTKRHPDVRVALVTMEYGTDVAESKSLATELGIGGQVHWFRKMLRRDIMAGLTIADVSCTGFANSWWSNGVMYEGLSMARPLLGCRDDALYHQSYGELYPMLNARTPEEVAKRLAEVVQDPERTRRIGAAGRVWYERCVVGAAVDKYVAYLEQRQLELRRGVSTGGRA